MADTPETRPLFYRFAQFTLRTIWRLAGGIQVNGRENVPQNGPFLLIANHQSFMDPMFAQTVLDRPVHAMAKSTQFAVPVVGWMLRQVLGFPVRRYQVDAQAVRTALRHLARGRGVAIYIEGERTWDGRLQEPRIGTARLALRAGVPIIPCIITGTYQIWPRWDRKPKPGTAKIEFRPAIHLPHVSGEENRRMASAAADQLMGELRRGLSRAS